MTQFSPKHCDIGEYFRAWMLAIPAVKKWVGDTIVDTINNDDGCDRPLIWYSRSGSVPSGTLNNCGGGEELIRFDLEIIADEKYLSETRRIAEILRQAANRHERTDPFGAATFKIQMIEIMDADDRFIPKAYSFLEGICVTAMAVEISPMFGVGTSEDFASESSDVSSSS